MWPLMDESDIVGAAYLPADGIANPTDATEAIAKAFRLRGGQIFEHTKVTDVLTKDGRVTGVRTEAGDIGCEVVVNCAGMWARELGAKNGVRIPLHAAEHFYLITEPVEGLQPDLPVLRCPDDTAYIREDTGKIMVGFFEPGAKPWGMDGIPEDFAFGTLPEDWDHLAPFIEMAARRLPLLNDIGIKLFFNGPESFTPDDRYILGEAPGLAGYFVAAGFNSVGFQSGPRGRSGGRRLDRRWPSADGPLRGGHPAVHAVPGEPALPPRADDRGPGPALRHALAVPPGRDGPGRPQERPPRPAHGRRGLLRRDGRLGTRQLVRHAGHGAGLRVQLRAPELVRRLGRGAPGGPRGRRRVRPELLRQAPRPGTRRRGGPGPHLRQRRRGRAGPGRLHAVAQRARRDRGRRDRHPPRRDPLHGRQRGRRPVPRPGVGGAPHPARGPLHRHRRHGGLGGPQRPGSRVSRAADADLAGRLLQRGLPVHDDTGDRGRARPGRAPSG